MRSINLHLLTYLLVFACPVLVNITASVPILVSLGLSVLELGPMYETGRQTDVRRQTSDVRQTSEKSIA